MKLSNEFSTVRLSAEAKISLISGDPFIGDRPLQYNCLSEVELRQLQQRIPELLTDFSTIFLLASRTRRFK